MLHETNNRLFFLTIVTVYVSPTTERLPGGWGRLSAVFIRVLQFASGHVSAKLVSEYLTVSSLMSTEK